MQAFLCWYPLEDAFARLEPIPLIQTSDGCPAPRLIFPSLLLLSYFYLLFPLFLLDILRIDPFLKPHYLTWLLTCQGSW